MDHGLSGRGPAGENEPGLCTPIAVLAIGLSPERADSETVSGTHHPVRSSPFAPVKAAVFTE